MAKETTEKKLYDLLATRDYDNFQALDSRTGKTPVDPETGAQDISRADMFTFDWSSSRGKNYGTAVILLTPEHELELYFGDNLGKTIEDPADKDEWFAFMEQLRHFATRTNFNGFRPLNINQLRHSLQGQAAIREGLFESWQGRRNMSWSAGPTEARLMIRHKRNLDEGDARHLYIESLFIETVEGERYKLPFAKLAGGRAMLEHVRQGGRPYDIRGQHIVDIVEELNVLGRFERSVSRETILEGDTAQLVTEAAVYRKTLKENLKKLGTGRGYAEYFESWNPVDLSEQDVVIESLKHMFVKQTLDARIEQALPLLARIQQQGNAMKEATIFEAWANRLVEGTWSTPDTPEAQQKLLDFMSREQPVGADATDATGQLYDLLGDDKLFDQLAVLAESDPNADCRQLVRDRMQELSDNPDVREVLEKLNIDADVTMNPPESLPADLDDEQEQDVAEGDVEDFLNAGGKITHVKPQRGPRRPGLGLASKHIGGGGDRMKPSRTGRGANTQGKPVVAVEGSKRLPDIRQFDKTVLDKQFGGSMVKMAQALKDAGFSPERILQKISDFKQGVAEDAVESLRRAAGLTENVLRDSTGSTLDHIADKYKRDIKDFEATGNLSDDLFDALYDYYQDDMPYGVQKARSGDPHEWIADRITQDLGLESTSLSPWEQFKLRNNAARAEAGMEPNPDFQEERDPHSVDGGMDNDLLQDNAAGRVAGSVAGAELGPIGSVIGGAIGDELTDESTCNMSEAGESCPVHGMEECWSSSMPVTNEEGFGLNPTPVAMEERSPLAGIYGHSGKMTEVGKDTSWLDRLKELAGMARS